MTDGTARRAVGAARKLGTVRAMRREAVRRGAEGALVMLTVPLPGALWDAQAHAAARSAVGALVGGWPAWYTLERGQGGALHAHVLAPVEAVPGVLAADVPGLHGVPVWRLRGLLAYLSKPRDADAARSAHRRAVSSPRALAAAERYLGARAAHHAATGSRRVPNGSGVLNMPPARRRRAQPGPLLLLAALGAVLGLAVADLAARRARWGALLAARRARSRRAAGPRAPRRRPLGTPAPLRRSLPVLGRAVPALGHARPPPIGEPRPGNGPR